MEVGMTRRKWSSGDMAVTWQWCHVAVTVIHVLSTAQKTLLSTSLGHFLSYDTSPLPSILVHRAGSIDHGCGVAVVLNVTPPRICKRDGMVVCRSYQTASLDSR